MASGRMMNSNGDSSKVTNLSTSWQQTISSCPAVFRSFLAGSISGTCSTIIFQPLDLVKTRLQASITSEGRPIGMISTFRSVVRTESVRHLWRGTGPSLARCVPGIGIYFASLHGIKSSLGIDKADMLENALIGGAARTVAGVLVLPFTVIKTRFESTEYGYKTISDALRSIYRSEGRRGLFSGMMPTLLRDVPYSGLYLMFYSKIKHSLPSSSWVEQYSPPVHFAAGMVAGMLASLFTQPADVLKTHAQLHPHRFSKLNDAVNHVYQNDGLRGFLRGIVPRTVKRTLVGALSWTVYEEIMRRMGLKTV